LRESEKERERKKEKFEFQSEIERFPPADRGRRLSVVVFFDGPLFLKIDIKFLKKFAAFFIIGFLFLLF
jgi:hypothetical protein